MPKLARENLYAGVNAHLQNLLPMKGRPSPSLFPTFHGDHITFITAALNAVLPDPYRAVTEPALQIRTVDWVLGDQSKNSPMPDSAIFRDHKVYKPSLATNLATVATPILELEFAPDLLTAEHFIRSVVIYEDDELGQPVTRIELLSPSNKAYGSSYEAYLKNRSQALLSGTNLVEIDYFHETPTPTSELLSLPIYPDNGSYPYNIAVSIPRQTIKTRLYGIGVDENLPHELPIPLLGEDMVLLDLQGVYNQTFIGGKWGRSVDYEQPLAQVYLATYRPDDQIRLETLRQAILQTHFVTE